MSEHTEACTLNVQIVRRVHCVIQCDKISITICYVFLASNNKISILLGKSKRIHYTYNIFNATKNIVRTYAKDMLVQNCGKRKPAQRMLGRTSPFLYCRMLLGL